MSTLSRLRILLCVVQVCRVARNQAADEPRSVEPLTHSFGEASDWAAGNLVNPGTRQRLRCVFGHQREETMVSPFQRCNYHSVAENTAF
ncbi:hypothetical protein FB567DRAFT_78337 [Paraphoma chrysanthemicola]|uniref:Secreted protein n=1 Tax=Paraphoma chrysanthemicola TaxID=798071 RepID=A0A8K0VWX8_9PLEO|nr:hypothetical protein FB567DRAFT_78337 [Paraphoma chrysanthemicola]